MNRQIQCKSRGFVCRNETNHYTNRYNYRGAPRNAFVSSARSIYHAPYNYFIITRVGSTTRLPNENPDFVPRIKSLSYEFIPRNFAPRFLLFTARAFCPRAFSSSRDGALLIARLRRRLSDTVRERTNRRTHFTFCNAGNSWMYGIDSAIELRIETFLFLLRPRLIKTQGEIFISQRSMKKILYFKDIHMLP